MIVGLIISHQMADNGAIRHGFRWQEMDDSRHGIRSVFETTGSLDNLHPVHGIFIDFDAVLITPLLTLLSDVIIEYDYPVVPETPDDGL